MPTTGQMIKAMRMNRGYSASVGADAVMTSTRCYYDIEGSLTLPNEAKLQALANRFRCDVDDLKGQDWIPDDKRTKETEKERKIKIFGAATAREIVAKRGGKTMLNGQDVTEVKDDKRQEEVKTVEDEQGETINKLRDRVKYLDGIIATKDEDIRTLKAQVEFAEADIISNNDAELIELRETADHLSRELSDTITALNTATRENRRLKDALAKIMLRQLEEAEV